MSMREYNEEEKCWIWLASLGLGAKTFYQVVKMFGSAAGFFKALELGLELPQTLSAETISLARAAASRQRITELLCELSTKNIDAITRISEGYPEPLANIPWPPPVLFIKGKLPDLSRAIGIVGTRRCSRRGYEFTRSLAGELNGMCVVSGMARGIDTAAHLGALDADAPTVAVLGCGVDVVYPPESEQLYQNIIQNGAVISELPVGAAPYMGNFPVRNRIIAGLSKGLLVVESESKGGTAITASLAVQYGKDVFAVPGAPYLSTSELPNALIAAGAAPVRTASDICDYYNEGKMQTTKQEAVPVLDLTQARIYEQLRQGDLSPEGVAAYTGFTPGEVSVALTMMELSGVIRRLPGGKYGV